MSELKGQPVYCKGCSKKSEEGLDLEPRLTPCDTSFGTHFNLMGHPWARKDYKGLYTGCYCLSCYNSKDPSRYPYRKDSYLENEYDLYSGESLYNEDNEY